jgi:methylisocitrate lyase
MARHDAVTPVFGVPTALHATIMERCGAEVGFIGTSITMGNYTALPDVGVVTMTESIAVARYVARAVDLPLILDGDTGFGGPHAIRRLVEECIDAGLAGLRLDDQVLETKRSTQSDGIRIVGTEEAIERYGAAVQRRDELDPEFVIMAQCYARDAVGGGLDECLERLRLYQGAGQVDWVQFESPHSIAEVAEARAVVSGVLSVMKGRMERVLSVEEHRQLGLNMAWYTFLPDRVLRAMCFEVMTDVMDRGITAWHEFVDARPSNPFVAGG